MPNVCGIENYVFVESPNIAQSTRVLAKNRSISFLPEGPVNTDGLQVTGHISQIIPLVWKRGATKEKKIDSVVGAMCYLTSLWLTAYR